MRRSKIYLAFLAVGIGGATALVPQTLACSDGASRAMAFVAESRDQLVGGQRALGDLGDVVLTNGRVRAVIQGPGASRGFGVFGGSLIDLDLERPRRLEEGRPVGHDGLSEIFPAWFLRGLEPDKVEVVKDGSDGGPAVVRVSGKGSEFITMVTALNDILLPRTFEFAIEYQLDPIPADAGPSAGRYIVMRVIARNGGDEPILLPTDSMPIGFGLVTLFGSGQDLFLPGDAGFDMRFTLEEAYKKVPPLPALPGIVSRALVSSGEGVSYAIVPVKSKDNFVYKHRSHYPGATKDSFVIPFVAESFTGMFMHQPPESLEPGESTAFEVRIYLGTGDVASALDLALDAREEPLGNFTGRVREEGSGAPLDGMTVTLFDADTGAAVNACRSQEGGLLKARLPPGAYYATVVGKARPPVRSEIFNVEDGQTAWLELTASRSARLSVTVLDKISGQPLPARVSVVGTYGPEHSGKNTRDFLFQLRSGEGYRFSDLIPDDPAKPETREYLEGMFVTDASGTGSKDFRPGTYRVVASRGPDYTLGEQLVELTPGASRHLRFQIERVVDPEGYIAGDFHVHTIASIDSDMPLDERARTYAAEGIDYLALTDHNYVADMAPATESAGLSDFLKVCPGLELTTLELGHFNVFPIKYDIGPVTHGSFGWFRVPAGDLFDKMRELSSIGPERAIVQVNHPRDTIMGYFNAYKLREDGTPTKRTDLARPQGPEFEYEAFSDDFNALEVINGKRLDLVRTFRVPEKLPPPPLPEQVPPAGSILRDKEGLPAFPGAFEDWVALLKRGKVITGMANSDSHKHIDNEAGYPRTLVRLGQKPSNARLIDDGAVADALRAQAAIMTNGPVAEIFVNGVPTGGLVQATDGKVSIRVLVRAAPWVDVSKVSLVSSDGTETKLPVEPAADGIVRVDTTVERTLTADAFFIVEATGEKPMWPVQVPNEIGPLAISDAVASIGGSFGFGNDGFGNLRPAILHPMTPYAITNPVWVDVDGDGSSFGKGKLVSQLRQKRPMPTQRPQRQADVLRFLQQFGR